MQAPPGYELVRELARGGMGVVYEARSSRLGRPVALKVIQPGLALDPDSLARLEREVAAHSRLRHPGIVPVLDAGRLQGLPWVAMELVKGESLEERIRRTGPLASAQAAGWARELALALAHAHAQGVLHRDLKPHNVLIGPDERPRLIDFGLALLAGDRSRLTATGVIMGSPAWMAPEQARAERERIDARTDVYGLGAVLYQMLCGSPPQRGRSQLEVLEAVLTRDPDPPGRSRPGVDPGLEAICLRCLARDPAARFPSMHELSDALAAWRPRRPSRPAPRLLAGVGLLLCALLGGATALLWAADAQPAVAPAAPAPEQASVPPPAAPAPASSLEAAARAWEAGRVAEAISWAQRAADDPQRRAEALLRWHELVLALEPHRMLDSPPRLETEPLARLAKLDDGSPWSTLARATRRLPDSPQGVSRALERLERELPAEPYTSLLLGIAQRRMHSPQRAQEHLTRALGGPCAAPAQVLLAQLELDRGTLESAREHLRRALGCLPDEGAVTPARAALRLWSAELRGRGSDWSGAAEEARQARLLDPGLSTRALKIEAAAGLAGGDEVGAGAALRQLAARGTPHPSQLDLLRAEVLIDLLQQEPPALEILQGLARERPDDPLVASELAGLVIRSDPAAALAILDRFPGQALTEGGLRTRESLRGRHGDPQERARDLDLLLVRCPEDTVLLRRRAQRSFQAGDVQGSLQDYDRLLALRPEPALWLERAQLLRASDPAAALEDIRRVMDELDLLDRSTQRSVAVALTNLGLATGSSELVDQALEVLDRLLAEDPGDLEARAERAGALANRGRNAAAARDATQVLEAFGCGESLQRRALSARSVARERQGDRAGALSDLEALRPLVQGDQLRDVEGRLARLRAAAR